MEAEGYAEKLLSIRESRRLEVMGSATTNIQCGSLAGYLSVIQQLGTPVI